jgi:hypothetical protein
MIRTEMHPGYARAVGDGDGDSLMELVAGYGEQLRIWESVAFDSLPSRLVLDTQLAGQADQVGCYDLDGDGHAEYWVAADGPMVVLESRGNDSFGSVPFPSSQGGPAVSFAVADFDNDGKMEVAYPRSDDGGLSFFECEGDNQYRLSDTMMWPEGQSWSGYWCTTANDMDRNGLVEFVSNSEGWNEQLGYCLVRIVEEPVHDSFVCVCTLNLRFNGNCGSVAAGDVDGDQIDEFAVSTGDEVRLFKCSGLAQYQQVWQVNKAVTGDEIQFFDLNNDGRDELLFSSDSTYIYEDTVGLGVAEFTRMPVKSPAKVSPSVARLGASLLFSGIPPGADIEVLSLDGRLVSRASGVRQSTWSWNLRNQSGSLVPAGTYFAVIRSREKSTSLKLCVVK